MVAPAGSKVGNDAEYPALFVSFSPLLDVTMISAGYEAAGTAEAEERPASCGRSLEWRRGDEATTRGARLRPS